MKHSILSLIFATSLISGSAFATPLTQTESDQAEPDSLEVCNIERTVCLIWIY